MVEVLPAILEKDFDEIKKKSEQLLGIVKLAQLDISDGTFVPEETWQDDEQLSELGNELKFDLHLMVDKPEQWIEKWSQDNIFRITFHFSATYDILRTINIIKQAKKEVGVALNLETPVDSVYDILKEIDLVLIMGITPGAQGRVFDAKAIDKIKELREHDQNIKIGVDGGVSAIVSSSIIEAGANMLVSGSYLFGEDNIKKAIKSLQKE
ncbi:ribulose-phosphate 3-epimerase [bacterium]|jgi:ribulose-phosphate 3-epimerase|nr:ribulose-phosphate 3-epimerase [bacterium]MDP6571422.1 ribulose-phosphate 3-epimerase [Patescibacteria group bacterium]MDP6756391.1 ribulose-phosphate 3-epimerase [Patescibacteria group bacterium]|tara:strand:+ start:11205 stop:11834 length:630 start_codon:yes stop_codon:yes gene_type:complete